MEATFKYIPSWTTCEDEDLYEFRGELPEDKEHLRKNWTYEAVSGVPVYDVRGVEDTFGLDKDGFCYQRIAGSNLHDHILATDATARNNFVNDCAERLRSQTGAERVLCYDVRFRRHDDNILSDNNKNRGTGDAPDTSIPFPHADHTPAGGLDVIMHSFTEEDKAQYPVSRYRFRVINIWKPIKHNVEDAPLALCLSKSIKPEELIKVYLVEPLITREVYHLKYSPQQKWVFLGDQSPEEVLTILTFDSNPGDNAKFCVHSAFKCPPKPSARQRESIEMRMVVISSLA